MPDIIDRTFSELIGRPCWQVRWKRYLGLDFSFGEPVLKVREPYRTESKSAIVRRLARHRDVTVKGEWWWWVQCGRWSLSLADDEQAITHSTSIGRKRRALAYLDGQQLVAVGLNRQTSATELTFDLGATLRIRGSFCDDGSMYRLRKRSGYVLDVCTQGRIDHNSPRVSKNVNIPPHPEMI